MSDWPVDALVEVHAESDCTVDRLTSRTMACDLLEHLAMRRDVPDIADGSRSAERSELD